MSESLTPVTISMIRKSQKAGDFTDWTFDGHPWKKISLVAQLISLVETESCVRYTLDDGTGRINAIHWLGGSQKAEWYWTAYPLNTYVRIVGSVGIWQGGRDISLDNIRKSDDPHELYYHLGEVMTANLILHRGPPQGVPPASKPKDISKLQRAIFGLILEKQSEVGVHVGVIAEEFGDQDALDIEASLQMLLDIGLVYTTINESTFRTTT